MKILIHDEWPNALEFLLESIVDLGYKVGIGKDGPALIDMVSGERYAIVPTNDGYEKLDQDQHSRIKSSSIIVIGITRSAMRKWTEKWICICKGRSKH
jgi:hypothetical protein